MKLGNIDEIIAATSKTVKKWLGRACRIFTADFSKIFPFR